MVAQVKKGIGRRDLSELPVMRYKTNINYGREGGFAFRKVFRYFLLKKVVV